MVNINSSLISNILENEQSNLLDFVKPKILHLRDRLKTHSQSYPSHLSRTLKDHFSERIARANGDPMIGEYAMHIFGQLLSISPKVIDLFTFPWLLLYEYSLLLDDILDQTRANWKHELILSQLLLDSANAAYGKLTNNNIFISKLFKDFRKQSFESMLNEINLKSHTNDQFSKDRILYQGRKSSLVKYGISAMYFYDKNRILTVDEISAIDCLCCGVQLLDDLTDLKEDHISCQKNALLNQSYLWLENNIFKDVSHLRPGYIDENKLIVGIILSGAASKSLEMAAEYFKKSLILFGNKKCTVSTYFDEMANNCKICAESLNRIIINESININSLLQSLNKQHTSCSSSASNDNLWDEIYKIIEDAPRGRN